MLRKWTSSRSWRQVLQQLVLEKGNFEMKKEDLLRVKKMLDDCAGDPCKERQFDQKLMHAVAKAEGLGAEGLQTL